MHFKYACPHCHRAFKFEASAIGAGPFQCPHCSMPINLEFTTGKPPRQPTQGARLCSCPDCHGTVSTRSIICPHCGRFFKITYGLFYYVFWASIIFVVVWTLVSVINPFK